MLSLGIFFIFLFWSKKYVAYVSLICVILCGLAFYTTSQHYISIGSDKIAYQPLFSMKSHNYGWNEVEKAVYHHTTEDRDISAYEFTFNDGEVLALKDNAYLREVYNVIRNRLKDEGVIVEEVF